MLSMMMLSYLFFMVAVDSEPVEGLRLEVLGCSCSVEHVSESLKGESLRP